MCCVGLGPPQLPALRSSLSHCLSHSLFLRIPIILPSISLLLKRLLAVSLWSFCRSFTSFFFSFFSIWSSFPILSISRVFCFHFPYFLRKNLLVTTNLHTPKYECFFQIKVKKNVIHYFKNFFTKNPGISRFKWNFHDFSINEYLYC